MKSWLKKGLFLLPGAFASVVAAFLALAIWFVDDEQSKDRDSDMPTTEYGEHIESCVVYGEQEKCAMLVSSSLLSSVSTCKNQGYYTEKNCKTIAEIWSYATSIPNHTKIADLYYQRAIVLGDSSVYTDVGFLHYRANDIDKAREYLNIGCDRGDTDSCFGKALIAMEEKKYDEFETNAELTCKKSKTSIKQFACHQLGQFYYDGKVVNVNYKKAEKNFSKSCGRVDEDSDKYKEGYNDACLFMGFIYERKNDKEQAEKYYGKACKISKGEEKETYCGIHRDFINGEKIYERYEKHLSNPNNQDSAQKSSEQESTQDTKSTSQNSTESKQQSSQESTPNTPNPQNTLDSSLDTNNEGNK